MKKAFVIAVIAILCVLIITGCEQKHSFEKITDSDAVPECVTDELTKVSLERGVYFFSETFTGSEAYIVFCGGKAYEDGYDVEISEPDYHALIKTASPPGKPLYGFYQVDLKEYSADKNYNYGFDSDYPLVIFKVVGDIGERAWPVLKKGLNMRIVQWWGSGEQSVDCKYAACSIKAFEASTASEGLVELFARRTKLDSYTNGQNVDLYRRDFKVSVQDPYEIFVESLFCSQDAGGGYSCSLVVSKRALDEPVYDEGEYYHISLEVDLLHERARLTKYLQLDDELGWVLE